MHIGAGAWAAEAPDAGVDAGSKTARPLDTRRVGLRAFADEARVERVFAGLDLRARAAQLVMAYPQINRDGPVEVGGVLFVGNSLRNLSKARAKIASTLERARIPPFVAVDMEGGSSNRMSRHPQMRNLPSARAMAELPDDEVEKWGRRVGRAMREQGLNVNLAPVLDVATQGHLARKERVYGGEPDVVVAKASAYARGLLRAGVLPIGKHYPGYGALERDSDHELVVSEASVEDLARQMDVFHRTAPLLGGVMLANVGYRSFSGQPAVFDAALVTQAHAREWVAMTDDLSIGVLATTLGGTAEDVLERALLAGNDILLTTAPPDWDKGLDYIGLLVRFAEESPEAKERIDAACRRVLRLKDRMGLLDGR